MNVDTSNKTFINTIWYRKDWPYMIEKLSLFMPVIVLGIFGNILVIYTLSTHRHIRTPANLLFGNMAAADLLSLLMHPWIFLTYDFFQNYQLGAVGCRGEAALECSILIASVISMSAITYDRLTAIVLPQETRLTQRGAKIVMGVTWIVGVSLSSPLIIFRSYKERTWINFCETYCTEETIIINIYWYVIITVLVWIPLTIQLICYISIFAKLNKYEKVMENKLQRQLKYKKVAARMIFFVILTFMICRLPFTGLIIYRQTLINRKILSDSNTIQNQVNGIYHTLWFSSKYLIFVNAMLNPVIYGITNEKFRRAFISTKLFKWCFPNYIATNNIKEKETKKLKSSESTIVNRFLLFFKKKSINPKTYPENISSTATNVKLRKYENHINKV